jgi:hypothetical protein
LAIYWLSSEYILSGQLVVASLLSRNIKSRLLLRDPEKASSLFGKQDESVLQVHLDIQHSISPTPVVSKKKNTLIVLVVTPAYLSLSFMSGLQSGHKKP